MRRLWESLMALGSFPGETDLRRGTRRIVIGYLFFGALTRFAVASGDVAEHSPDMWVDLGAATISVISLVLLGLRPRWFTGIVKAALFFILVEVLAATVIDGGLVPSEMVILFGLLSVVGALIVLSLKGALGWFLAFVGTLVLAVFLPTWIRPLHQVTGTEGGIAVLVVGVTTFLFAGMAYFVRQRNRFQEQSDDLLRHILPDQVAGRLKADRAMIADEYESVSVLFADIADFTPMSATMTPAELVGLLNSVFTDFDGFVAESGLEKIKTVGDAYMVAAGVPVARPDHAHAIADLAVRFRDHVAAHRFDGRAIDLRIGINSGPVVAGVVGTHKFAYDLWGDVVNTASRMESGGVRGSIQITEATFDLIRDAFVCEPRGVITVKGKGDMNTYFLVGRRS
jgi:adenylate cyclase